MPRYDDRYGTTRLYVGHLSSRTRSRDLEHIFSRYGSSSCGAMYDALPVLKSNDGLTVSDDRFRRVRDVDMKHDFAFVEFSDPRDADDARYSLNGREFDGNRLVVEFAKGVPRGPGGSREYLGRGPLPGSGRCFNCGLDGHWARDCKAGDWKNKCYRCGERGHIEKNCHNSPKKLSRRGRSYSRSPIRSGSPRRGRSRSRSFSRSRSYSLSRSPPPKRERIIEREMKSRSPRYSRSPEPRISPPSSKSRKRSPTPEEGSGSPVKASSSPNRAKLAAKGDGPNNSESPRARSRSPERDSPFPSEANGHSPSPRDDRSPINDEDDNNNLSPRDSQSP